MLSMRRFVLALTVVALQAAFIAENRPSARLDQQAYDEGRAIWEKSFSHCDEFLLGKHLISGKIVEIKDISVLTFLKENWRQSEADSLNGIEWVGTCPFLCKAYRTLEISGWSEWKDGILFSVLDKDALSIPVTYKQGKWEFGQVSMPRFMPVGCGQVPK